MVPNDIFTDLENQLGHLDNQDTFGWSQGVQNIATGSIVYS